MNLMYGASVAEDYTPQRKENYLFEARTKLMIYSFYWQNNRSTYRNSSTVNV